MISLASALTLSFIFLAAGIHKVRDTAQFGATLGAYGLLPGPMVSPVSILLPAVEFAVAVSLLLPDARINAAWAGAILLCVYTLAIGINLARGRRAIDCGCGGPSQQQPLSEWLLLRNGVLIGAIILVSASPLTRPNGWLEWSLSVFAAIVFVLLYSICNQLLANSHHLINLQSSHG